MSKKDIQDLVNRWREGVRHTHEVHRTHLLKNTPVEPVPMQLPDCKLLEEDMEKRGVVIDDEKTKTASIEKVCPECGAKLDEPDKCPNCGTKPFEKRQED